MDREGANEREWRNSNEGKEVMVCSFSSKDEEEIGRIKVKVMGKGNWKEMEGRENEELKEQGWSEGPSSAAWMEIEKKEEEAAARHYNGCGGGGVCR